MQALQELADDGVHLLEIDDAGLVATVQELDALRARVAELEEGNVRRQVALEARAEPTPRDMRVAYHAWNHGFTKGREYEALDTLEAMQRVGEFTLGEGIDLAAVVAKAVGT